jgi:transposase
MKNRKKNISGMEALPPNPRDLSLSRQDSWTERRAALAISGIPAPESALGLRLRRALSSAQVRSVYQGCKLKKKCSRLHKKLDASGEFLEAHPKVKLHFTPTYSSWLNQVEIWFSKIQRDVIARGIFTSVADLKKKLMRYIKSYAKTAKPIRWTYCDVKRRIRAY